MPRTKAPIDPERQLTIKTKACQRLSKEALYYVKEVEENKAKLEKMKLENRDFYDIKKFGEVLGESEMMVPDSRNRLIQNLQELHQFLVTKSDDLNAEGEWFITAKKLLCEHSIGNSESNVKNQESIETNIESLKEGEAF